MRGGDLGSIVWVILIVLGIVGKLMDKKGPRQPPVAGRRPGQPQGRPGQPSGGWPGQSRPNQPAGGWQGQSRPGQPAGRPAPAAKPQTGTADEDTEGQSLEWADQPSGRMGQPSGLGRPSREVSRPMVGQSSAVQSGRLVAERDQAISPESVRPTVREWDEAKVEPEAAPEPIAQAIPAQQAIVWAEILGKPVALRGRRSQ